MVDVDRTSMPIVLRNGVQHSLRDMLSAHIGMLNAPLDVRNLLTVHVSGRAGWAEE
jgi:hypothetical protein